MRSASRPIPPPAPRGDARGMLQRELWIAEDAGEQQLAAQLRARLAALDPAPQAAPPQRETTRAANPRKQTTGRKPQPPRTQTARKQNARRKP